MTALAVIAAIVLAFGLVSRRVEGSWLTAPMVFVALGLVLGDGGAGAVEIALDESTVLVLAEAALVLVLFTDAARMRGAGGRDAALAGRLLGIGLPLTIAGGLGAALLVLGDIGLVEAAIVATVLAPTDAALGQAVVTNPAVPARVRRALNVESGLNDGLSVPVLTVLIAVAVAERDPGHVGEWARLAAEQIGIGALVGAAAGLAGGHAVERAARAGWMTGVFEQLAVLALALIAWGAAELAGGNGFIAAFVAGIAAASATRRLHRPVLEFTEEEGQLLNLAVFFVFGAAVLGPLLPEATWRTALYAALSLTVVRMAPVALALLGSGLRGVTVALVGWFGPRGLASIVLALVVMEETGVAGREDVLVVASVTVLASTVAHGVTAGPLGRAYARRMAAAEHAGAPERAPVADVPARTSLIGEGRRRG